MHSTHWLNVSECRAAAFSVAMLCSCSAADKVKSSPGVRTPARGPKRGPIMACRQQKASSAPVIDYSW